MERDLATRVHERHWEISWSRSAAAERPRKTLGFQAPVSRLQASVVSKRLLGSRFDAVNDPDPSGVGED